MSETHHIVGLARGEPLSPDRVGVRVCFPLSGSPSPRRARKPSWTTRRGEALGKTFAPGHVRHTPPTCQGEGVTTVAGRDRPVCTDSLYTPFTNT